MRLTVQVKLLPDVAQSAALGETLRACNAAASYAARVAFERSVFNRNDLQKLVYGELKERFGLSAQAAVRVVKKTVDAYTVLRANIKAGNIGAVGSIRRVRAESKPIAFRPDAAQPFDDRCLSWQADARTISIWTTRGRLKGIRFVCTPEAAKLLAACRRGESDLVHRDGMFFLHATCEVPETVRNQAPAGFLGVDLGIVNIATTSDGSRSAGRGLNRHRRRQVQLRAKLQAKGTKSAKRLLKQRRRKEARRAMDVNHCISKSIVAEAERTGRGIAVEDLTGIRARVRLRKPQRATVHSWAFHQLGSFISYKARRAGVPVIQVDPAYTSQECHRCHHTEKANRPSQALFSCRYCGFVDHADRNAAHNIASRGWYSWVRGAASTASALPIIR